MSDIEKLVTIMARLRDPENGCPWDKEQTFETIVPHTLEEAYEVAETIETGDLEALRHELGDLLFQVIFYSRLAEERGLFDFQAVVASIVDKLIRRHPHVFGDARIADAEAQTRAWEALKAQERAKSSGQAGTLEGVTKTLPALTRASKLQKRAARVGFDWSEAMPIFDKIQEELEEVRQEITDSVDQQRLEEEIGDLLFACTNLARHLQVDPEGALRGANAKFEKRFAHMEALAASQSQPLDKLTAAAWEDLWQAAKSAEHKQSR